MEARARAESGRDGLRLTDHCGLSPAEVRLGISGNDPHTIENVAIRHEPSYHTYSRWVLDGLTYVIAYRDIDDQPEDIVMDIYLVR